MFIVIFTGGNENGAERLFAKMIAGPRTACRQLRGDSTSVVERDFVRVADRLIIAQHFIAGNQAPGKPKPALAGDRKQVSFYSAARHGLRFLWDSNPSDKSLGYFQPSAARISIKELAVQGEP